MKSRLNPPCSIIEAQGLMQQIADEMKRMGKTFERLEREEKKARRRGEWGRRGVR